MKRHTNMLLLDVIRLLQYHGITIGGIFYSNYQPPAANAAADRMSHVEELADIYDMLDLITGAKEFMQWCLSHGNLQQAITLYTETVPA